MLPKQDAPVSVFLAGTPENIAAWYPVFLADPRFRVAWVGSDANSLSAELVNNPEVLVVGTGLFAGPSLLIDALVRVSGCAYVVLPFPDETLTKQLAVLPSVKGVFDSLSALGSNLGAIHAAANARRQLGPQLPPEPASAAPTAGGLKILAVWNQCGGGGKSTLATNLAYESAKRGRRTLFIGLGAPDVSPLMLGLSASPNIAMWRSNPTPQGLKSTLQKVGDLDVLAGFPDVLEESKAVDALPESEGSITKLVMLAAYEGYATIVLDLAHSQAAPMALAASNYLILVARPTLADAWCTVEAWRTLQERMGGHHRIGAQNVLVVLNRMRAGSLSASEWHNTASRVNGRPIPAVAACFPEDPQVEQCQEQGKLPVMLVDSFSKPLNALANTLFGAKQVYAENGGRRVGIGPFTLRVK